jgi:hypothetical protein
LCLSAPDYLLGSVDAQAIRLGQTAWEARGPLANAEQSVDMAMMSR